MKKLRADRSQAMLVVFLCRLEMICKHNYITLGVFNGYTGQLHVSAYTGHLQVVFQRI